VTEIGLHTLSHTVQKLPVGQERWQLHTHHSGSHKTSHRAVKEHLKQTTQKSGWKWPKKPIFFISDPHADAEAFLASLLATGGIQPPKRHDKLKLTRLGQRARFVIGGDCLDKGPNNLRLLESIHALYRAGANVTLIAGNHDVRLLMGLRALEGKRDVLTEHLFIRMGKKVVPLIAEVFRRYLAHTTRSKDCPSLDACRRALFPRDDWFYQFPKAVEGRMPAEAVARELERMGKKIKTFEAECLEYGMTLQDVYATANLLKKLFLRPRGEFGWFFKEMTLAKKQGSFLFLHAGLDDSVSQILKRKGVRALNQLYKSQLKKDLFEFYYGTVANVMRTKYRPVDLPLTPKGVRRIHRLGIYAVVHGHLNRTEGQRIRVKHGLLHIEGDITLDRNSRRKEGLDGIGLGFTQICPSGRVIGLSRDYPRQKVFTPAI
jgi:hypothetical protein